MLAGMLLRACAMQAPAGVDAAFGWLDRVAYRSSRQTRTQWQVVFDLFNDRIYYRTQDNAHRRAIDMGRLDFACTDPIRMRDIRSEDDGFADYTHERNRRWIETFLKLHPFKRKENEARVDRISRYPDSLLCR